MRKISSIFLGIVFMISMALSPVLSVRNVKAGVFNEYRHRTYETEEELEQLRTILLESGYVELIVGSREYERLANEPSFWYNNFMNPVSARFYTLYVLKSDLEEYMSISDNEADFNKREDAIFYLKENIVIISTYELMEQDDGAFEGLMGNDIPDNWKTCLLTVKAEVEEGFSRDIIIKLIEKDTYYRYTFSLQKNNGYDITIKFPAGNYDVESITCNSDTPVLITYDSPQNGFFEFYEDTAPILLFNVGDKKQSSENNSVKDGKTVIDTDINKDNGGGQIDSTDNNQLVTVTPEQAKKDSVLLLIIEMLGIIIIIITCILFVRHLKKKAGRRNDSF